MSIFYRNEHYSPNQIENKYLSPNKKKDKKPELFLTQTNGECHLWHSHYNSLINYNLLNNPKSQATTAKMKWREGKGMEKGDYGGLIVD